MDGGLIGLLDELLQRSARHNNAPPQPQARQLARATNVYANAREIPSTRAASVTDKVKGPRSGCMASSSFGLSVCAVRSPVTRTWTPRGNARRAGEVKVGTKERWLRHRPHARTPAVASWKLIGGGESDETISRAQPYLNAVSKDDSQTPWTPPGVVSACPGVLANTMDTAGVFLGLFGMVVNTVDAGGRDLRRSGMIAESVDPDRERSPPVRE